MTFTYTTGWLTSSGTTAGMTKVRRLIGDVDSTRQQLQDEEIYYVLNTEVSPTLAAAAACDMLAAVYAFQVNTENVSLKISAAARHKQYQDLADRLRKGGAGEIPGNPKFVEATMYVGGSSVSAKNAINGDSDNAAALVSIGQDDSPYVGITSGTAAF